jgi:Fe2+ or Zn2+ uptake regulation protein
MVSEVRVGGNGRPVPRPEDLLRDVGLKVTAIRVALLELITRRAQHMTADEITDALHESGMPVDRVTVYRNIERMLQEGLLAADLQPGRALKVAISARPSRVHHHHIVCDSCGKVTPTDSCYLMENWEQIRTDMLQATGYQLSGHLMQYLGTCPECTRAGT